MYTAGLAFVEKIKQALKRFSESKFFISAPSLLLLFHGILRAIYTPSKFIWISFLFYSQKYSCLQSLSHLYTGRWRLCSSCILFFIQVFAKFTQPCLFETLHASLATSKLIHYPLLRFQWITLQIVKGFFLLCFFFFVKK